MRTLSWGTQGHLSWAPAEIETLGKYTGQLLNVQIWPAVGWHSGNGLGTHLSVGETKQSPLVGAEGHSCLALFNKSFWSACDVPGTVGMVQWIKHRRFLHVGNLHWSRMGQRVEEGRQQWVSKHVVKYQIVISAQRKINQVQRMESDGGEEEVARWRD